jgi:hypothetical protein
MKKRKEKKKKRERNKEGERERERKRKKKEIKKEKEKEKEKETKSFLSLLPMTFPPAFSIHRVCKFVKCFLHVSDESLPAAFFNGENSSFLFTSNATIFLESGNTSNMNSSNFHPFAFAG